MTVIPPDGASCCEPARQSNVRSIPVEAAQAVPQRALERLELLLIVSPVADRGGIDRAAHLLGARCAYGARILVKAEAARLERQSAMREQAADVRFRIAHQILVLSVQDLPWQHLIPVVHQGQVAAVVPAEILQVVAEGLAGGK